MYVYIYIYIKHIVQDSKFCTPFIKTPLADIIFGSRYDMCMYMSLYI